jgi:hypothetical protein
MRTDQFGASILSTPAPTVKPDLSALNAVAAMSELGPCAAVGIPVTNTAWEVLVQAAPPVA